MTTEVGLISTELIKDVWTRQHESYREGWWLRSYWESTEGSQRDAIIHALEGLQPASSVLEVGCNTGPNLRRIHARWPQMDCLGMDIHRAALKYGQDKARGEGWDWAGYCGDLRDLHTLGPDAADIILSCYALAYLDPRDIQPVLDACVRAARRAVVLCEPMVLGVEEPERFLPPAPNNVPEYQYNYGRRLEMWPLSLTEVSPPHGRLTHVLTLKK